MHILIPSRNGHMHSEVTVCVIPVTKKESVTLVLLQVAMEVCKDGYSIYIQYNIYATYSVYLP